MEDTQRLPKDAPEEIRVVLSDMHLAGGLILPNGQRNTLEEFEADREFNIFIDQINERFSRVGRVKLILLGDIFDSQAVLFKGKNTDTPYEAVHRYKMNQIIRAHPIFFDALIKFLSRPGRTVDFYIGNHDFFVEWKSVQEMITKRLAKVAPLKIRFLYTEDYKGVHYFHGNFEPHAATNMKQIYLTERFGITLKRPLLNYPYGTLMTVAIINRLKKKNRLIGRLRSHGAIWRDCLMRDWGFGVYALILLLWNFVYNRFFAFWDVRKKARLGTTLKIILWTITGYDLKEYARRVFEEKPDTKVVICGHDHEAARVTISRGPDSGTYINTGTWTKFFDIAEEPLVYRWKKFRALERYWLLFKIFIRKPKIKAVTRLTFALIEHFTDQSLNARLLEFRPQAPKDKQIIEVI